MGYTTIEQAFEAARKEDYEAPRGYSYVLYRDMEEEDYFWRMMEDGCWFNTSEFKPVVSVIDFAEEYEWQIDVAYEVVDHLCYQPFSEEAIIGGTDNNTVFNG